jgi:hypothetical protein
MSQTHYCKCCRGIRPNDGVICQGCGTALVHCRVTKQKKTRIDCPACASSGPHRQLEPGRMTCVKCNGVFEGGDVGYLDDRPDVNVEKKERLEMERRRKAR